jgi:hypothetical protein
MALNNCGHSKIEFKQAGLMFRLGSNVMDSLSCLYTIINFDLGGYGVQINPNGNI